MERSVTKWRAVTYKILTTSYYSRVLYMICQASAIYHEFRSKGSSSLQAEAKKKPRRIKTYTTTRLVDLGGEMTHCRTNIIEYPWVTFPLIFLLFLKTKRGKRGEKVTKILKIGKFNRGKTKTKTNA